MRPTTAYITSSYGARYLAVHSLFKEMFRSTIPPEARALFVWLMESSLFLLLLFFLCNICTFCQVNTMHVILYCFVRVLDTCGMCICYKHCVRFRQQSLHQSDLSTRRIHFLLQFPTISGRLVPWRAGKLFCREYYVCFQNCRTQGDLIRMNFA